MRERADMIDHRDRKDRTESDDPAEPTENAEKKLPTEPIEQADPIDPMESTEPFDPMESTEFSDQSDNRDVGVFMVHHRSPGRCPTCGPARALSHLGMNDRVWFNSGQPQTLQYAVILLYFNGVLGVLQGIFAGALGLISAAFAVGQIASGFGIANERKWGYWLGIVFAFLPFVLTGYLLVRYHFLALNAFSLLFEIVLVVLLLHPMTREYRKIWFR